MNIERYWALYALGRRTAVYRFIVHNPWDGYYYFRHLKNDGLVAKKQTELYKPDFKPLMIDGGKTFYVGAV